MKHNEDLSRNSLSSSIGIFNLLYSETQSLPNFLLQRLHQLQFAAATSPIGTNVQEIKNVFKVKPLYNHLNKFTKHFIQRTDHYT